MKRLAVIVTATAAATLGLASPSYAYHCYNASNPVNLNASKGTYNVSTDTFEATNPGLQKRLADNPDADIPGGRITYTVNSPTGEVTPLVTVYAHKKGVIPNGQKGPSDHGVNYLSGP